MIKYLKQATRSDDKTSREQISRTVADIVKSIEERGDEAIREFSQKFDNWSPPSFQVSKDEIADAMKQVPTTALDDIKYAQQQISTFAQKQREALQDTEVEIQPGVILGHKNIPVNRAGCYVPGGKYPLIAAASMSIVTAKVAGVKHITAMAPPQGGKPHPVVVATMHLAGADSILMLGGIQAIAAMAYGIEAENIKPVDIIVGPGNAYVAEAKRQLFGVTGIDLLAGPTETLVVADDTVDGELCAVDLLGQAEHGPTSPAVLITDSQKLAEDTMQQIERLLKVMPTGETAAAAWRDYGEVILCDSLEAMVQAADEVASEHVQIMTRDDDYFLQNLTNFGALFLGPRTNVCYGDKVIGTNHTLPTLKAARYTGGLWVGKFLKTCTYQRVTSDEASVKIGEYAARLCMLEGMKGHAEQANIRVRRYGGKNIKPYSGAEEA